MTELILSSFLTSRMYLLVILALFVGVMFFSLAGLLYLQIRVMFAELSDYIDNL